MKKVFALIALLMGMMPVMAQEEDEYRLNVGAGAGLYTYQGDFNAGLFSGMRPMANIFARYVNNPRSAWRLGISYGAIGLNTKNCKGYSYYRDHELGGIDKAVSRKMFDVAIRYEYNFWAYGTGREYRGAKPLAPFLSVGAGVCSASGDGLPPGTAANMALGVGLKYKISTRLNLVAEWNAHFATGDKLDGIKDPQGIESSGLFKNTDMFTSLQLSISYDLWAKCPVCNKAD